jgi:hypothetical protein
MRQRATIIPITIPAIAPGPNPPPPLLLDGLGVIMGIPPPSFSTTSTMVHSALRKK